MATYGPFNRTDGQFAYQRTINSRDYTMTATVTAFVQETELRLEVLAQSSIQDLIEIVQQPVGEGGKMRVKTGFLRATGQVSFSGMPAGPERGEPGKTYKPMVVDLSALKTGMTVWFGWTANYAPYREAYDGFLISGIQRWQTIVDEWCVKIEQRVTSRRKKKS